VNNPPLVSNVGSRYVPEVLFDRFAIYVRSTPGQAWKNDYWSNKVWTRIEPRALNPGSEPLPPEIMDEETGTDAANPRMARTSRPNPAAAPFLELEDIPKDAAVWKMPMPMSASGK
jgi:hypothetical protein